MKIKIDPRDINVDDTEAAEQVKQLITATLMIGETGGQALGLLITAIGELAAQSDERVAALGCAISCLVSELEDIDALTPDERTDWKARISKALDDVDAEREPR